MTETGEQLNFFDPLKVQLSTFEGPLELLLDLVRKKKMDLNEISLSEICEPYINYLELMEEFDLDIAMEFLEIASTLILIKSRSLLPKVIDDLEDDLDPEVELKKRLIEYMKYKEVADTFSKLDQLGRDCFPRPEIMDEEEDNSSSEEEEIAIFEELSVYTLLKAYQSAISRKKFHKPLELKKDELPIEQKILQFMHHLKPGELYIFEHLLPEQGSRAELVISFLAVLELAKLLLLKLHQINQFGTIHCEPSHKIEEKISYYENLWQKAS